MTSAAIEVFVRPMQSLNTSNDHNISGDYSCDRLVLSEDQQREVVIKLLEELEAFVNEDNCNEMNCNDLIEKICHWIKWKARHLEEDESFRQQLDVYFNLLRNVLRNFKLNAISRALILEVIELRAANWTNVEDIDRYYRNKLSQLKANDTSCAGNDLSRSKSLQSF
ncbi:unnamed protein product, partial [Oppiella nova]